MVRLLAVLLLLLSSTLPALAQEGHVLRIHTDFARGRVWVLATDGVYLQERPRVAARRFTLPGWMHVNRPQAAAPDLILDHDGTAIVSSNIVPHLWRVDPERASADLIEVDPWPDARKDMGFTSLVLVIPGSIRARSTIDSSGWRIDLRSRKALPYTAVDPR